jgi:DNA-3-methyladenine glycosylase I
MKKRCSWCLSSDLYKEYHDTEWGRPVYNDSVLFEFLLLETFQAGLSWITILNKRENFKKAFNNFDYLLIANYTPAKETELLENKGIIRNKLKIKSARINAIAFIEVQREFQSFSNYIWGFVDGGSIINKWETLQMIPATTNLSDIISKDLKKRGFKFIGSTVIYAYLQAIGVVNDHVKDCWTHTT